MRSSFLADPQRLRRPGPVSSPGPPRRAAGATTVFLWSSRAADGGSACLVDQLLDLGDESFAPLRIHRMSGGGRGHVAAAEGAPLLAGPVVAIAFVTDLEAGRDLPIDSTIRGVAGASRGPAELYEPT